MPMYNSAQSVEGFVSLAQICSSPNASYGQDMADGELFEFDLPSPMPSEFFNGMGFGHGQWDKFSCQSHPKTIRRSTMPIIPEYASSSPSNSPSPTETVQEQQHQKRRAQNRAAQRAYRDRKVRHQLDLEDGIRDIEKKIMFLQNENTELIRLLCETRTANNHLRSKSPPATGEPHSRQMKRPGLSRSASDGDQPISTIDSTTPSKTGSLYEPFAAMWNLIRLDPSVVQGKVSARTLLEDLSRLAEAAPLRSNTESCTSPVLMDNEGSPSSHEQQDGSNRLAGLAIK